MRSTRRAALALLAICFLSSHSAGFLLAYQAPSAGDSTYSQAYQRGYNSGFTAGREDRRKSRRFDFESKKAYRKADEGFDRKWHDEDVYFNAYRSGFAKGYQEGFGLITTPPRSRRPSPPPRPLGQPLAEPLPPRFSPDGGPVITVPMGTEFDVRLLSTLSTKVNVRGETFLTEVVSDVRVDGRLAIPAGTKMKGVIENSKRAGRIKGRAQMDLKFIEFMLDENRSISIEAVTAEGTRHGMAVFKPEGRIEAESGEKKDAGIIGAGLASGVVIGSIMGGKKGAAVGMGTGAIVGVGRTLLARGKDLILYSQAQLHVRLERPARVPEPLPPVLLPQGDSQDRR